jgi:hypothetical protein
MEWREGKVPCKERRRWWRVWRLKERTVRMLTSDQAADAHGGKVVDEM